MFKLFQKVNPVVGGVAVTTVNLWAGYENEKNRKQLEQEYRQNGLETHRVFKLRLTVVGPCVDEAVEVAPKATSSVKP